MINPEVEAVVVVDLIHRRMVPRHPDEVSILLGVEGGPSTTLATMM